VNHADDFHRTPARLVEHQPLVERRRHHKKTEAAQRIAAY
jgi:hypothetical protein